MHLSDRITSAGRGTGRYDAVDLREIVCRQPNLRGGAHILLEVLARFRAGYRYDKGSRTRALGPWPSDGELGERGVLPARDGPERRAQPEVLLDIGAPKRGSRVRISSAAILRDALNRLGSADFGKVLPSHSPQAAVGATAVQRYSL